MVSRDKARFMGVLLSVGYLTSGCGAGLEETQPSSPDTALGETGAVAQELTSTCTSSAVSLSQPYGQAVTFQYPICSVTDSAAKSDSTSYGQELCPNHFVTEVQGINNRPFTAFVELVPSPGTQFTQGSCEGQVITGTAWGYSGSTWTELGSISSNGVWHPGGCGGLFCVPASCQVRFNIANASGYSKARVAGFGAALGVFKGIIRTGVQAGPGPC